MDRGEIVGHETGRVSPPGEARRAEWRRRADDPRTVRNYLWRGELRLSRMETRRVSWAALAAITATTLAAMAFGTAALGIAILALFAVLTQIRPGARDHASLPTLGEDASFPVTLSVTKRGWRMGRENGWIAFVDGWLVYEGMRTSFALRSCDVRVTKANAAAITLRLEDEGVVRLELLTDSMQTQRPARGRDGQRMREAWRVWRDEPSPAGEPVLPPNVRSVRTVAERASMALLLGLMLGVFGALLGAAYLPLLAFLAVAAALPLLASGLAGIRRLRAMVEREEPLSVETPLSHSARGEGSL